LTSQRAHAVRDCAWCRGAVVVVAYPARGARMLEKKWRGKAADIRGEATPPTQLAIPRDIINA